MVQPAGFALFRPRLWLNAAVWASALALLLVLMTGLPVFAAGDPDLVMTTVSHTGTTGDSPDYRIGSAGGSVTATFQNAGVANATAGTLTLTFNLQTPSFTVATFNGVGATFTCLQTSTLVNCTTNDPIAPGASATVTLNLNVVGTPTGPRQFVAQIAGLGEFDTSNNTGIDLVPFSVLGLDLGVSIVHSGTSGVNYLINTSGTVTITVTNSGTLTAAAGSHTLVVSLNGGLTRTTSSSSPLGAYACVGSTGSILCTQNVPIAPGVTEILTFNVTAPGNAQPGPFVNQASLAYSFGFTDNNSANNTANDPVPFAIVTLTTATFTPSLTPTITLTAFPTVTLTPLPSLTFVPLPTIVPTRTLIPPIPTRTPLPRPQNAGQAIPIPASGISIVVNRDNVNVRLLPAIGAEVIGFVNANQVFENVSGRSGDNQWLRIDLAGQEGWIGTPVITVLNGADINTLPVADPRTIPYGGFAQPRAGVTSVGSPITGRLVDSGLRVRGGPGRGYPVLANAPRYTIFSLLGRSADNQWWQVNFEGTLGWVAAQFVGEISSAEAFNLPIDGIIADGLPVSLPTGDSYTDTLRLMLARVDLAQPSINRMRDLWNAVALGGQAQCGDYPARPSDYNIPLPLLSAFNGTLGPLQTDFNRAMGAVRQAIDLFIEACNTSQPAQGLIGVGGAAIGLQAVNDADGIFADLRARLIALIPNDGVPTDEQCLFTFNESSEIVDRLRPGQAILITWPERDYVRGFCFDGTAGEVYRFELVRATGNVSPQVSIASFNDPANFIAAGRLSDASNTLSISNITVAETGRYLILLNDFGNDSRPLPQGEVALLLTNLTGFAGQVSPGLTFDINTGQVIVNPVLDGSLTTGVPGTGGVGGAISPAPVACPNPTFTCLQLSSCDQARACLFTGGNLSLDLDSDGIPCEENLCLAAQPTLIINDRGE